MERVQKLTADSDYRRYLCVTAQHEIDRPYCHHDYSHLLAVARISWILCLERQLGISQSVVYAAALLHDLGRFAQYEDKRVDHASESARLAVPLLHKYGFTPGEIATIQAAISAHRQSPETLTDPFSAILAEADDLSRSCHSCTARDGCYKFNRMATAKGIRY